MPSCYCSGYDEDFNPYAGRILACREHYIILVPYKDTMQTVWRQSPMSENAHERRFLLTQLGDDFAEYEVEHTAATSMYIAYQERRLAGGADFGLAVSSLRGPITLHDLTGVGLWCHATDEEEAVPHPALSRESSFASSFSSSSSTDQPPTTPRTEDSRASPSVGQPPRSPSINPPSPTPNINHPAGIEVDDDADDDADVLDHALQQAHIAHLRTRTPHASRPRVYRGLHFRTRAKPDKPATTSTSMASRHGITKPGARPSRNDDGIRKVALADLLLEVACDDEAEMMEP